MVQVSKQLPIDLDDNSKYLVRVRSINNFGVPSDWSDSIIVNTETMASNAGSRLLLTNDSIFGYDSEGALSFAYFGSGVTRTNYAKNPSFDVDTGTYDANTFSSISSSTDYAWFGNRSCKVESTTTASGIGFGHNSDGEIAVSDVSLYTVSMYILSPVTNDPFRVRLGLEFYNASSESLGIVWGAQNSLIQPVEAWQRIASIGIDPPPNALNARFRFETVDPITSPTEFFYVDALLIEQTGVLREYFDGDTLASQEASEWHGTPHNSFSDIVANEGDVFVSGSLTVGNFIEVGGAAADVNAGLTNISGNRIRTGDLQSTSYSGVTNGSAFSTNGTNINLDNGSITAEQFRVDTSGNAFFKGNITGASGTFSGSITGATGNFQGVLDGGSINIGGSDSTSFHVDTSGNMWMGAGSLATTNPFRVESNGSLHIGGVDTTSFHVDNTGNLWIGAPSGTSSFSNSNFRISNAGVVRFGDAGGNNITVDSTNPIAVIQYNGSSSGGGIYSIPDFTLVSDGTIDIDADGGELTLQGTQITLDPSGGTASITLIGHVVTLDGTLVDCETHFRLNDNVFYLRTGSDSNHVMHYWNVAGFVVHPASGIGANGPRIAGFSSVVLSASTSNFLFESGGSAFAPGSWLTFSSITNKRDIETLDPNTCLQSVARWRPVAYTTIKEGWRTEGFIAEELCEVSEKLVARGTDNRAFAVDYSKATVQLTGAIQALLSRIEILEAKLENQ